MKRNELLKLPAGEYLLTDNICNYKYRLVKFEPGDSLICFIYNYDTGVYPSATNMAIFYSQYIFSNEDSIYDTEKRRLECNVSVGGISTTGEFYRGLSELKMIGKYNKETVKQDFERFKKHYKISCSRYYKKRIVTA
ncbi:hypothetical protein CMT52_17865 [Elizabethkingia anophelis]|nr:hypothetical protein [Elizabethkingia anophelis]